MLQNAANSGSFHDGLIVAIWQTLTPVPDVAILTVAARIVRAATVVRNVLEALPLQIDCILSIAVFRICRLF